MEEGACTSGTARRHALTFLFSSLFLLSIVAFIAIADYLRYLYKIPPLLYTEMHLYGHEYHDYMRYVEALNDCDNFLPIVLRKRRASTGGFVGARAWARSTRAARVQRQNLPCRGQRDSSRGYGAKIDGHGIEQMSVNTLALVAAVISKPCGLVLVNNSSLQAMLPIV